MTLDLSSLAPQNLAALLLDDIAAGTAQSAERAGLILAEFVRRAERLRQLERTP